MRLNKDLGFYIPAFFMMQVDTIKPIEGIIGTVDERTFSHELIHFLQDITTTYGLINISRCIDFIKVQNSVLRNTNSSVKLPLQGSELSGSVMINNDLFSLYVGDSAEKFREFPDDYIITEVIEDEMDIDNIPYPIKYIEIKYGNRTQIINNPFHFGSMAIYESMANLIENEIYGENKVLRSFPYDSALMIAENLCPLIYHNKLAIAELCEASLMFYNPAEVFIDSLRKIQMQNLIFKKPNEYYLYVLDNFTLDTTPPTVQFMKDSKLAMSQLNDLFTVSPFREEKWASGMVYKAQNLRNSGISLSAVLWGIDKDKSKKSLIKFISDVGMPIIFNSNFDAWVRDSEENMQTPLMHQAIFSFYEILRGKQIGCSLYKYCIKNNVCDEADHNCISSPWLQLKQEKICYFSNLWKMWGLEGVHISVK
ncbi:hypothetical protein ABMZ77_16355 [Morganella morganii]|uniref:hypothetical protein n=1 Tax=Morganella morganii TaxID=582 RepID=UPI003BB834C6